MGAQYRQRQLRNLSSSEIGWVAGLLEGEGSFIVVRNGTRPRVQMQSTDEDVLLKLRAVLGAGRICPISQRANRKQCWAFALNTRDDIDLLLRQIYPMMGARRRVQIDLVLAHVEQSMADKPAAAA